MKIIKINSNEENFPFMLKEIEDKPSQIFISGDISKLQKPCIAFVGTRNPTAYGIYCCRKIIEEIAMIADICIVSGLALGIDTIAHKSAIEFGLSTIAVLGSGINNIYPRSNLDLAKEITKNGLLISEYENAEGVKKYHFPQRNRIISGLSHACIAIEAPEKSGTLITMNYAVNQNRLSLCVVGDIDRAGSAGCLKLVQKGCAYPVSSGKEVIDYIRENSFLFNEKNIENKNISKKEIVVLEDGFENEVYSALSFTRGLSLSEICKKTGINTSNILSIISLLEIKGIVYAKTGKFYKK